MRKRDIFHTLRRVSKEEFAHFHLRSDKTMLWILGIHWGMATFLSSQAYDTYTYGFVGGGMIVVPMLILYTFFKGERAFRILMGVALMLFSMIFIQQHLGRIEMHFHVFIALGILTLYKDLAPIIAASMTTIVHHLAFNYLQLYEVSLFNLPVMIFNYGCGLDIVLLHAFFVTSELFVLGYVIRMQIAHATDLELSQKAIVELNRELQYASLHDALTGLPNRTHLNKHIEHIRQKALQEETKFALIFLDLDHFKNINDTLGHDIGDALLKNVSDFLKHHTLRTEMVSRIGGDEFILIVKGFQHRQELEELLSNISQQFHQEFFVKGYALHLSASIGVSVFPDDAQALTDLMKYADIAMYKAKAEGRDSYRFFEPSMSEETLNDVSIINDMQRALREHEFVLYYQPKIDITTQTIVGAEALLRWNNKERGMITPMHFIQFAEDTGAILALGREVVLQSMQAINALREEGMGELIVSINISMRQFQNNKLFELLSHSLQESGANPHQLGIEITENILMNNAMSVVSALHAIKALGVRIYLDDFGTGYSSLAYLRQMPIDVLKIDKSFIDDIGVDTPLDAHTLLTTIIQMSKAIGLKTIAEGVEQAHQVDYLKAQGCDMIQGYYYAKPMPFEAFVDFCRTFKDKK